MTSCNYLNEHLKSTRPLDNLSQISGPLEPPLWKKTVGELFDQNVAQNGEELALISDHENIEWNYSQLGVEVNQLIASLTRLGIEREDRVGIYMPNIAIWVVFQYALAKLGAILVPINPAFCASELAQIIRLAKLKALVAIPKHKSVEYVDIITSIVPQVRENKLKISSTDFPHLHYVIFASEDSSIPSGAYNLKSLKENSATCDFNTKLRKRRHRQYPIYFRHYWDA